MPFYISPPPRNPLTGILAGVVGVFMMIGAFMLGFVVILVAVSVGLLIWIGVYIRVWWMRRQMIKQGIDPATVGPFANRPAQGETDILEAEYEVISKKQDD